MNCNNIKIVQFLSVSGHLNTVKMLVDNNANVNEMGNKKDTALILAAQHGII